MCAYAEREGEKGSRNDREGEKERVVSRWMRDDDGGGGDNRTDYLLLSLCRSDAADSVLQPRTEYIYM